ncbi:unnamed protein product, partial [Polarella glacialis]
MCSILGIYQNFDDDRCAVTLVTLFAYDFVSLSRCLTEAYLSGACGWSSVHVCVGWTCAHCCDLHRALAVFAIRPCPIEYSESFALMPVYFTFPCRFLKAGARNRGNVNMTLVWTSQQEIYMSPGERDALQSEVDTCDREAEAARQNRDQQQLLMQLEKGLHLRRKLFQEASQEVSAACRRLCEACNFAATVLLQQENLKGAHELLKRAEQ